MMLDDHGNFNVFPGNPKQIVSTAVIFLRVLSNPFLESKAPLEFPKALLTVGLVIT